MENTVGLFAYSVLFLYYELFMMEAAMSVPPPTSHPPVLSSRWDELFLSRRREVSCVVDWVRGVLASRRVVVVG